MQEKASSQFNGATCTMFSESVPTESSAPVFHDVESEVPTDDPSESTGTGEGCVCYFLEPNRNYSELVIKPNHSVLLKCNIA